MPMSRVVLTLRTFVLAALALCCALAAGALVGVNARAATTHPYTGVSFGPSGTGAGNFSHVGGVTVRQSTGDVLVYDAAEGKVYKFDAGGAPVDFSSTGTNVITEVGGFNPPETEIAVDDSAGSASGDIYVATGGGVRIYAESGAFLGELDQSGMCGVAVDPTGAVYVGIYPQTVKKYVPVMNPVTSGDETSSIGGLSGVCNVAADSEGNLYTARYSGGITRYEAAQFGSSAASGTEIDRVGRSLAIDPMTDDIFSNAESRIYQYEPAGGLVGISAEEEISFSVGIGVSSGAQRVYVPSGNPYIPSGQRVEILGASAVVPDVANGTPEVHVTTATLKGTVNPDGLAVTSCQFEYRLAGVEGYEGQVPCSSLPGSGGEPTEVNASLSGLEMNTAYQYRLVVGNSNGTSRTEALEFTTFGPGLINAEDSSIGTRSATIVAHVQPNRQTTTVTVEYGQTTAYGSSTSAVNVGSGTLVNQVTIPLEDLTPGTTYHARVVVSNASGTVDGTDIAFVTYALPEVGLPDGRIYEKVSPNNNADGNVYSGAPSTLAFLGFSTDKPFESSPDGQTFTYSGAPAEKGGVGIQGTDEGDQYLATRASSGWSSHNITPYSSSISDEPHYVGFSSDLSAGFLIDAKHKPLAAGAPAGGYRLIYEDSLSAETLRPLVTVTPPNRQVAGFSMKYGGISADRKHVLFVANDTLAQPSIDGGGEQYNLYDDRDGTLLPVNVLPNGTPEPNASFGAPGLPDKFYFSTEPPNLTNDISEDGRRIFWTADSTHDLYLREDDERTVQIDASVGGEGQYWTSTPDGSKVLFTKGGHLYEYEVDGAQTTDLTAGEVLNVVGTSKDLSYVYFIAAGAIAPGAEAQSCEQGAACNLYVLHSGEPVKLLAKIAYRDKYEVPASSFDVAGLWTDSLANKEAQVTPDGTHLVFGSTRSLTAYEADGREEVYVYDYADSRITCVSCDPTGSPSPHPTLGAYLPISNTATYLQRWMSEDGNRVFFDSVQPLVPQDTNGANDVYEWERDGTNGCAKSEGCVRMLSGGTSNEGSFLDDTSANGDDVFIGTREALVTEDENENIDIYDVRANVAPPPAAPQCTGTGCQGLPFAPPVFSTPSSVTYNGVGNFAAPRKATSKAKKPKAKPKKKVKKKRKVKKKASKRKARKAAAKHATNKSDRRGK
jgi:hypothetical protein